MFADTILEPAILTSDLPSQPSGTTKVVTAGVLPFYQDLKIKS
jgi:hypothetical protein